MDGQRSDSLGERTSGTGCAVACHAESERLPVPLGRRRNSRLLEHHAHVVQSRNEAAAIYLAAAGCPVAEPNDVGAALTKSGGNGQLLGVVGE